jgi:endo-1,3(4)-beta-glucanase
LVRDVANPSQADKYFPVSRAFDWFHGHSWAKGKSHWKVFRYCLTADAAAGLFQSGDGKDEESSSEDVMWAYSMRQWGREIGEAAMEARGNMMLAVLRRSLNEYMLLSKGCPNHPERFVMNKVTGIVSRPSTSLSYQGTDFLSL